MLMSLMEESEGKDLTELFEKPRKDILKEKIDLMKTVSEVEKIHLLRWVARPSYKKGHALYNLFKVSMRFSSKTIEKSVYEEMVDLGILEKQYSLICPECREQQLVGLLTENDFSEVISYAKGESVSSNIEDTLDAADCERCGYINLKKQDLVSRITYVFSF